MTYENRNAAYDLDLFKDSAAKKLPEEKEAGRRKQKNKVVTISEQQLYNSRRRKHNPFKMFVYSLSGAVITVIVTAIIMGQVQLTELSRQIDATKAELRVSQSTYTQLQMGVQSSLSTSEIEKYAENKLGMTKADGAHKEFISLSEGDKAELSDEANKNFFQKIIEAIAGLWS